MVQGTYPCVRAGKITEALVPRDWSHDVLCLKHPRQLEGAYRGLIYDPFMSPRDLGRRIAEHEAELVHVNNAPNWPVIVAKEYAGGRPVILDVHDLTCSMPGFALDIYEEEAFRAADAFVFVTEEQRDYGIAEGLDIEGKPYAVIANYASASLMIDHPVLPHLGGVVYEGGLSPRGEANAIRDLSPVADALGDRFHVYPANTGVDYGVVHTTEGEYPLLIHRLSQHDWGFVGTSTPVPACDHSLPNKIYDYLGAGIPLLAMHVPLVRPLCEDGLGVYCDTLEELVSASERDPAPFAEAVREQRERFVMDAHIDVVAELYETLVGSTA
jgi:hypothetical protein